MLVFWMIVSGVALLSIGVVWWLGLTGKIEAVEEEKGKAEKGKAKKTKGKAQTRKTKVAKASKTKIDKSGKKRCRYVPDSPPPTLACRNCGITKGKRGAFKTNAQRGAHEGRCKSKKTNK